MRFLVSLGMNPAAVAYSMTTVGAGMMNSIFSFYYVKLFLSKYKISEGDFHRSQVIYMIWNAINDPLFGYIQDNSRLPCCSQRRLSILYGAPLYCLAFLIAWFPWRTYSAGDWLSGLHLSVALCAFDGLLTFVLLAQCALFAEISARHQSRLQLVQYSQGASLLGSSSVLFCSLLSHNMEDFGAFQGVTVLVAVLACCCMLYTGFHSDSRYDTRNGADEGGASSRPGPAPALSLTAIGSMTWQIVSQRDFQLFVIMNFFQVFMVAFCNNFTLIFAEHLIPQDALSSTAKSILYGAGFICPQILVLSSQRLLQSLGYYRLILLSFYLEAGAALVMLLLGQSHYYILAVFIICNMVLVQATFNLFNLPLADIIDLDLHTYKRSSPLSSMVFGTNALFTKPAQSLAPMLVVTLLNKFGYEDLKDVSAVADPSSLQMLHGAMFRLVCLLPLGVALLQSFVWRPFSIRDSHTVDAKYAET
ncbi:transmembrane protein 180-like [Paramormyrops kingsleyae]|uniref:transmembrane protein 180-like n=1 Tax=Paramormyrops kingsleyae TaxID=1676925 RepID=UPI003B96AF45